MEIRFFDINSIKDDEYNRFISIVSAETLERISKMRFHGDKMSTLTGEAMARIMLSEKLGIAPDKIVVKRTDKGKPYVEDGYNFNIAHSSGMVAVALNDKPIGIDIEKIGEPKYEIMRKFCTDSEKEYVLSATGDEKKKRFYEIWTLKEAYFKCTGDGICGGLLSVSFDIDRKVNCSDLNYECGFIYDYKDYVTAWCVKK